MGKAKYLYKGQSLRQYCIKNKISYEAIHNRLSKIVDKGVEINDTEIEKIINIVKREKTLYFYKGISLKNYCDNNEISYKRIYRKIKQMESEGLDITEQTLETLVNLVKETTTFQIKYYYKGIPLKFYCDANELPYESIQWAIKNNNTNDSLDTKIQNAIDSYLPNGIKYYYKEIPFIQFCANENLNYGWGRKLLSQGFEINDVVNKLIQVRNKKQDIIIKEFLLNNINNYDIMLDFAKENDISLKVVKSIVEEGFTTGNEIFFAYYYGTLNSDNQTEINKSLIVDAKELLNRNPTELILEELLFLDSIGFIKYRYYIKMKMKNVINRIIYQHVSPREGIYHEVYQMLEDSIDYVLRNNFINDAAGFTNYCKKVFKGWLMRFFIRIMAELSIEINGHQNYKANIDVEEEYVQNETNHILYNCINNLPEEEKKYIILKFGFFNNNIKNDDEILNSFPGYDINQIEEIGKRALAKLKGNEQIRNLRQF